MSVTKKPEGLGPDIERILEEKSKEISKEEGMRIMFDTLEERQTELERRQDRGPEYTKIGDALKLWSEQGELYLAETCFEEMLVELAREIEEKTKKLDQLGTAYAAELEGRWQQMPKELEKFRLKRGR